MKCVIPRSAYLRSTAVTSSWAPTSQGDAGGEAAEPAEELDIRLRRRDPIGGGRGAAEVEPRMFAVMDSHTADSGTRGSSPQQQAVVSPQRGELSQVRGLVVRQAGSNPRPSA